MNPNPSGTLIPSSDSQLIVDLLNAPLTTPIDSVNEAVYSLRGYLNEIGPGGGYASGIDTRVLQLASEAHLSLAEAHTGVEANDVEASSVALHRCAAPILSIIEHIFGGSARGDCGISFSTGAILVDLLLLLVDVRAKRDAEEARRSHTDLIDSICPSLLALQFLFAGMGARMIDLPCPHLMEKVDAIAGTDDKVKESKTIQEVQAWVSRMLGCIENKLDAFPSDVPKHQRRLYDFAETTFADLRNQVCVQLCSQMRR